MTTKPQIDKTGQCRKCGADVYPGHCLIAFYPYVRKEGAYEFQLCGKCEFEFRQFINAKESVGPW